MQNSERNLVSLIVSRGEARQRLNEQIERLDQLNPTEPMNFVSAINFLHDYWGWRQYTKELLRRIFSNDDIADEFDSTTRIEVTDGMEVDLILRNVALMAFSSHGKLHSIIERLELYPEIQIDAHVKTRENSVTLLDRLANGFHSLVSQLTEGQQANQSFFIADEHNLQNLFLALLKVFWDDVRPEEPTPSYAGKSSRADFLIKSQQIMVELKMTRRGLADKKIGDELIIDIDRYKKHPDCKTLFCFVYDPGLRLKNAFGIEDDLSGKREGIDVKVVVSPKR